MASPAPVRYALVGAGVSALVLALLQTLLAQRLERAQIAQMGPEVAFNLRLAELALDRLPPEALARLSGLPLRVGERPFQVQGEAGLAQAVAGTEAGEIAQARPCGLSRLSRWDYRLNGAGESNGHGRKERKATRIVSEIIAANAASARASRQCCRILQGLRPIQVNCGSTAGVGIYKCRRLQPVMVASAFSRCHCSGPRPWVQPHRR